MMYYRKDAVNAMQTAMIALILLTSMSSFSCDVQGVPKVTEPQTLIKNINQTQQI